MSPPFLHVIYAGNGDALAVEDGDKLYLIDGGPTGSVPQGRGGARYGDYVHASLLEIADSSSDLKPTGVVVSHAHADHYGGLKRMFVTYLSTVWATSPTKKKSIAFNGPWVNQVLTGKNVAYSRFIGQFHFTRNRVKKREGKLFDDFYIPNADPLVSSLYQRRPALPEKEWGVDVSPENLASVLMSHRATKMVFTGDNAGFRILEFLPTLDDDRQIPIFKVPHHGSLRNSQRDMLLPTVPRTAWMQYGLVAMGSPSSEWDKILMPRALRHEGAAADARSALRETCRALGEDFGQVLADLRQAFDQTLAEIAAGGTTFPPGRPPDLIATLWEQARKTLEGRQMDVDPMVPSRGVKRGRDEDFPAANRCWISKQTPNELSDVLYGALTSYQLRTFFEAVGARNHVISASGKYTHPAAETLAAIALSAVDTGKPARVLVTEGKAVQMSELERLAPRWADQMELRYLSRGSRMILDPTSPNGIAGLDPEQTTANLMPLASLADLDAQFKRNRGAPIAARGVLSEPILLRAGDGGPFLNLLRGGVIRVTGAPEKMWVDQAWLLGLTSLSTIPFPGSFNDIRVRTERGGARLLTILADGDGWLLSIQELGKDRLYVCSDEKRDFLTPYPDDPSVLAFEFVAAGLDATTAKTGATGAVSLRQFLATVGVPPAKPLSGTDVLPQLVGPKTSAVLEAGIESHLVTRALGWDADVDRSMVTYLEDEQGPLVTAATLALEVGTPANFKIEEQEEEIASVGLTLARDESSGAVAIRGEIATELGTSVLGRAVDPKPTRSRPLDQYLFALGVEPEKWPDLTGGTLLTAILGAEPVAKALLLEAPSSIVAAGIAEWTIDHGESEVEIERTVTGGYTEVTWARLAMQAQAAIPQEVEGLALSFSAIALEVSDARLPGMELALTADAMAGTTELAARAVLSDGSRLLRLELPTGSDLQDLLAILPSAASGVMDLQVPLADDPLGTLGLADPSIEVHQPSAGVGPYELAAVAGTVAFDGWRRALPQGWPNPGAATVTARVLAPLDAEHRQLGLEVDFALDLGPTAVPAWLRAQPLPGPSPDWSYRVGASPDPLTQTATAPQLLEAVGLSGAADSLATQLPALAPLLPRLAVAQLTLDASDPGDADPTAPAIELELVTIGRWELLPGVVTLRIAQVELLCEGDEWSGEFEGEAIAGPAGVVAVSGRLASAELPGSISFEGGDPDLTIAALATLCGLTELPEIPIVAGQLGVPVGEVELTQSSGAAASLASAGFAAALPPLPVGVLDLDQVGIEVLCSLSGEGDRPASTAFWIEAQWGEEIVASLLYDGADTPLLLRGQLRPIAPVQLGGVLAGLLGKDAESTLLAAVAELGMASGTLAQDSERFELLSCALTLDAAAALPVATATASELTARWAAPREAEEEGEEEVPEVYLLDGRLTRNECEHEAGIEVEFRGEDDRATTVSGTIRRLPAEEGEDKEEEEAKEFTVATLLELLDLERPEVLTPEGAPEFFDVEPTSVEAVFSVEPFRLEALTIIVATEETLPLLPAPQPIELHTLTLRIEYVREPEEGEPSISGVVLGDLPLPPKAVTLAYAEPEGEEAAFRAELVLNEKEAPDFRKLIEAEPYNPGYGLPEGLGIPAAIPMTALSAIARPGEYVDLRGHDEGTLWKVHVDEMTMNLAALGGRVRVTPGGAPNAPHEFELSLFGRLEYHRFLGAGALFTWGPQAPSLLTAEATEDAGGIDLPAVAADLGAPWAELVPTGTPAFAFATAWTYADLTDPAAPVFDLYGDGSLGSVAGPAALLSQPGAKTPRCDFLFGAAAPGAFPLRPLWPGLGGIVDRHLSLAAGNLAALTEAETAAQLDEDLAVLAAAVKHQEAKYTPPFADLPPLAEALPAGTGLSRALTLVAKVDPAGQGSLSTALARIAEPGALSELLAWGPIDHDEPQRSRFEVNLTGLVLLGGDVTVETVAEYLPSEAEALIAAKTVARVEIGTAAYDFTGRLVIEAAEASFATAIDRDPIPAPLGATGVAFRNPKLTALYSYPDGKALSQRLRIAALVDLEVEPEEGVKKGITCDGAIEFSAGTAAVAVFQVPLRMAATDVYANGMTEGAWPAAYPSFGLEEPRFHAAPETVTIEATEYEAGYHALAIASFFAHPFPFDLTIEAAALQGSGASTNPIDLVYLELGEPDVSIQTGAAPAFALGGGARIFKGGDFDRLEFDFDPALGNWTGATKYGDELVGVDEPEVRFSYTDAAGLRLLSWPLKPKLDDEELDWEEELEEASEGSECPKLEDLGLDEGENEDKTVETEFDLVMEQVGPLAAPECLTLVMRGTYTVTVTGPDGESETTMPFPETTGTIVNAGSFQLDQLEDWVKETIEANHEALGKSLLEERDVDGEPGLESFLEGFDFGDADAELLAEILCREEGPKKVRERTKELIDETEKKSTQKREEAKRELEKVKTSVTISLAFGFLIVFFAWITIVFEWMTALFGLFGFAKWWLPIPLREEWEEAVKKAEEAKEEGEEAQAWAETELLKARGVLAVAFTDLTTVEVSWDDDNLPAYPGMDYEGFAGFSFDVEVAIDPEFEDVVGAATVGSPAAAATVTAAALGLSNNAFARMRPTFKGFPGTWIAGRAFHLVPLPAPAPVSQALNATAEAVDVTFTTVTGALSYTVELVDLGSEEVVAEATALASDPQPATISCPLTPRPVGEATPLQLLGRAKAVGDPALNEDSPFASAPEAAVIPTVGPPEDIVVTLVPDGVEVTWKPVSGATVTAQVRDNGVPLSPQPHQEPTQNGCLLSGSGIVDGAELQVVARAEAPDALEPWSAPVPFTARVLPPPQKLSALYLSPENTIHAFWVMVTGAEEYEVELLDAAGERLEPTAESKSWGAILSGDGLGPGKFCLRVRATAPERVSLWAAWLPLIAEALQPPSGLELAYESELIWARWDLLRTALAYPLEIEASDGAKAAVEPSEPQFGFGAPQGIFPRVGASYQAQLRARVGDSLTAIASAGMTMPSLLAIAEAAWAREPPLPVEQIAAECLKLEAALGPAQLWYTLLAAGYSGVQASAGVRSALPGTTPAELARIGDALSSKARVIGLLRTEEVAGAVIVGLCHALYSPAPLALAILLKEGGAEPTGLAAAFAESFAMPIGQAETLVTAVFVEAWHFGAVVAAEGRNAFEAVPLLRVSWPGIPEISIVAALKEAPYWEMEMRIALGQYRPPPWPPGPFSAEWASVHEEPEGRELALLLRQAEVEREAAARCLAVCWPGLSPQEVAYDIEFAYGPPP